jgi:hypothetical protein
MQYKQPGLGPEQEHQQIFERDNRLEVVPGDEQNKRIPGRCSDLTCQLNYIVAASRQAREVVDKEIERRERDSFTETAGLIDTPDSHVGGCTPTDRDIWPDDTGCSVPRIRVPRFPTEKAEDSRREVEDGGSSSPGLQLSTEIARDGK